MRLTDNEATARTADIVRILLSYALDPVVISGGERPPGRELVEASARKLLSELIDLSEKPLDPELSKPFAEVPIQKKKSLDEPSQSVEMKKGDWDWTCPKYVVLNFYYH